MTLKSLPTVLLAVLCLFAPSQALAQSCTTAFNLLSDIRDYYHAGLADAGCDMLEGMSGTQLNACAGENPSLVPSLASGSVNFWNANVNNSWATIGPRRLDLGMSPQTGTIVSTTERLFVSSSPMAERDQVRIRIRERSGRGRVQAIVCSVDLNGEATQVASHTFNANRAAKQNENELWSPTIQGVAWRYLTVHLDGKSVGNRFGYRIQLME